MSESVQPHRRQPTRLPRPWDSPGKNTGVSCHFLLQCMKVKSESEVSQSVQLFSTTWTAAHQAPSSMGFSRQEYWSGVPLPSPIYVWGRAKEIIIDTLLNSVHRKGTELLTLEKQQTYSMTRSSCQNPILHWRNQESLEKWLILALGRENTRWA